MGQKDTYLYDYIAERMAMAESGRAEALYDLGLLYSTGQGVQQDFVEAHKWFNLALERGLQRAEVDRHDVALELDRGGVAKAQRLARDWSESHKII